MSDDDIAYWKDFGAFIVLCVVGVVVAILAMLCG